MLPFPIKLSKLMCTLLGHQVGNNNTPYLERISNWTSNKKGRIAISTTFKCLKKNINEGSFVLTFSSYKR